jgi:hypothetical protein
MLKFLMCAASISKQSNELRLTSADRSWAKPCLPETAGENACAPEPSVGHLLITRDSFPEDTAFLPEEKEIPRSELNGLDKLNEANEVNEANEALCGKHSPKPSAGLLL